MFRLMFSRKLQTSVPHNCTEKWEFVVQALGILVGTLHISYIPTHLSLCGASASVQRTFVKTMPDVFFCFYVHMLFVPSCS